MAYIDIPSALLPYEVQFKSMFSYFCEKGIDISLPFSFYDLKKLLSQYNNETGNHLMQEFFSLQLTSAMLVAPEARVFSLHNDIYMSLHSRYGPVPIHSHEYFEMMCVLKGNCTIYIGDIAVPMQTGDTMIVPPYVGHTLSVFNDDCVVYNHEIRFSTLRSKFSNLFSSRHVISELFVRTFDADADPCFLLFHAGDYYLGDNKFGDIIEEHTNQNEYSNELLNILTSAYLFDLLRRYANTATITTIGEITKIDILLTKYITEHADSVTLAELRRKFSYSDRQIARIIKKNTGLAYSQLVKKIKMEGIAKMVASLDVPIEKIIEMSGASSASYFYKTFKTYFGQTPLAYRAHFAADNVRPIRMKT